MRQHVMFKLGTGAAGTGLRCNSEGLFLGSEALLQQDEEGNFHARSSAHLRKVFTGTYREEADWESRIRSVALVANALNKGDMARATMTAVLMRLPDPAGPVRIADVDGGLAKAGFNPNEPRDERGRWTTGGNETRASVQIADADMSDASDDPVAQAAARAAASGGEKHYDEDYGGAEAVDIAYNGKLHDVVRDWIADAFKHAGIPVLTEVPLTTIQSGVTAEADVVALGPHGKPQLVEVKTGDDPGFTPPQRYVYEMAQVPEHVFSLDPRVAKLGFEPRVPLPAMDVTIALVNKKREIQFVPFGSIIH